MHWLVQLHMFNNQRSMKRRGSIEMSAATFPLWMFGILLVAHLAKRRSRAEVASYV
ncbi:hypothetical protein P0R31_32430 [Bradyrhizobium yuanmingense]|uniref:hypothetical protein n=1 Tax=Bradyrhizobium yuanmingense TaxID=108015 RepID=UPI0023B9655C|nr:hypothetical protein [Bradyrhizobium yuanmingense]MDF0521953.1 hypothetical protein [Bradyrhizobium yuanmingense]